MIKRMLLVPCALLLALAAFAVPAAAYPPGGGTTVTTDKSSYVTGSDVTITAVGFAACAGQTVTFTITPPNGGPAIVLTAIANPDGTATVTFVAPPTTGRYTVVASSSGCANASTVFDVTKRLPTTGSDTRSWLVSATALVLTGVGFVIVTMRRRKSHAAE